jgi:hypothetical protein
LATRIHDRSVVVNPLKRTPIDGARHLPSFIRPGRRRPGWKSSLDVRGETSDSLMSPPSPAFPHADVRTLVESRRPQGAPDDRQQHGVRRA